MITFTIFIHLFDVCFWATLCQATNYIISFHCGLSLISRPPSSSPTGFEESRQDRIVLQDIDGGALQLLIDYVYTAEVLVTEENVQVHSLALCWP